MGLFARTHHKARLGSVALLLTAVALLGLEPIAQTPTARANPHAPPVHVFVGEQEIAPDADLRAQAVAMGRQWLRAPMTIIADDRRITETRQRFGGAIDVDRLERLLEDAHSSKSAMRRLHAQELPDRDLVLSLPTSFDEARVLETLLSLKDELDAEPRPARVNTTTREVVPHQDGYRLDVWETIDAIEATLERGGHEVHVVAETVAAGRRTDEIGAVPMDAVLGSFETRYNTANTAADRTYNLRVAAERIDGMVLMPGESFDFNETVGERSEANGFRVAPVIAAGELVDGIGGGTCQISGTLHAAVFFAGLSILERRPHSRPSSYIKLGLDAAVSYPSLNFRFQNDRDFPIVLGLTVERGVVRGTLWGARHDKTVTFVRRVDETSAFEERSIDDASLPRGVRVLSQRGIPGFDLTRWRIHRDPRTNQAVRERFKDEYPPTTQIWRVGAGGEAPEGYTPPVGDEHPEYTADTYLEMTAGVGLDGFLVTRRAGRTGTRGWTARAGYAAPEDNP